MNSVFPEDNKSQNIFIVPFNAQGQLTDLNMRRKASHQIKHNTHSKASPFPDGQIYIYIYIYVQKCDDHGVRQSDHLKHWIQARSFVDRIKPIAGHWAKKNVLFT